MTRKLHVVLFCTMILLVATTLSNQLVMADDRGVNSWVTIDVLTFDGQSITARITLRSAGNHNNATVRIYGEVFNSSQSQQPCPFGICITNSVSASVGRMIREVTFSIDSNITTFQYLARFASTYHVNDLLGLPNFPFDEHSLTLSITTNYNARMDGHEKAIVPPSPNYVGFYHTTTQPKQGAEYNYSVDLYIRHPGPMQSWLALWTWGVIALLFALTGFVVYRSLVGPRSDALVTASSAIVVFVPVFELSIQSYKAPLGLVLSDFFLFLSMVINVILVVANLSSLHSIVVQKMSSNSTRTVRPTHHHKKRITS